MGLYFLVVVVVGSPTVYTFSCVELQVVEWYVAFMVSIDSINSQSGQKNSVLLLLTHAHRCSFSPSKT